MIETITPRFLSDLFSLSVRSPCYIVTTLYWGMIYWIILLHFSHLFVELEDHLGSPKCVLRHGYLGLTFLLHKMVVPFVVLFYLLVHIISPTSLITSNHIRMLCIHMFQKNHPRKSENLISIILIRFGVPSHEKFG